MTGESHIGGKVFSKINKPGDLPITKDVWNFPDKVPTNEKRFPFCCEVWGCYLLSYRFFNLLTIYHAV